MATSAATSAEAIDTLPLHIGVDRSIFFTAVAPPVSIALGGHEIEAVRYGVGLRKKHRRRDGRVPVDRPDLFVDVLIPASPRGHDDVGRSDRYAYRRRFLFACRREVDDALRPIELVALVDGRPSRRLSLMPDPQTPTTAEDDTEPCPPEVAAALTCFLPGPAEAIVAQARRLLIETIAPACDPPLPLSVRPPLCLSHGMELEAFVAAVRDVLTVTALGDWHGTSDRVQTATACLLAGHARACHASHVSGTSSAGKDAIALLMRHYRPRGADIFLAIPWGRDSSDAPGETVITKRARIEVAALPADSALARAGTIAEATVRLRTLVLRMASEDRRAARRLSRLLDVSQSAHAF